MQRKEFQIKSLRSLATRLESQIPKLSFGEIIHYNFGLTSPLNVMIIGAHDGFSFDKYSDLLFRHRPITGVMLEPIKEYFEELHKNFNHHQGLTLINAAIGEKDLVLWKVDEDYISNYNSGARGLASCTRQHLLACGVDESHIISETVVGISLDKAANYLTGELDLVQIDTEGKDYWIWSQMDVEKHRPAICKVEIIHMKYWDVISMVSVFHKLGYVTQFEDGDCFAYLPSKIKLP